MLVVMVWWRDVIMNDLVGLLVNFSVFVFMWPIPILRILDIEDSWLGKGIRGLNLRKNNGNHGTMVTMVKVYWSAWYWISNKDYKTQNKEQGTPHHHTTTNTTISTITTASKMKPRKQWNPLQTKLHRALILYSNNNKKRSDFKLLVL